MEELEFMVHSDNSNSVQRNIFCSVDVLEDINDILRSHEIPWRMDDEFAHLWPIKSEDCSNASTLVRKLPEILKDSGISDRLNGFPADAPGPLYKEFVGICTAKTWSKCLAALDSWLQAHLDNHTFRKNLSAVVFSDCFPGGVFRSYEKALADRCAKLHANGNLIKPAFIVVNDFGAAEIPFRWKRLHDPRPDGFVIY